MLEGLQHVSITIDLLTLLVVVLIFFNPLVVVPIFTQVFGGEGVFLHLANLLNLQTENLLASVVVIFFYIQHIK